MFFKFIATAVLALGVAGIIILVDRLTGRKFPKWILPAGIAIAILSFSVFDEYNWYTRKTNAIEKQLDNYVILSTASPTAPWRPWSYILAPITALTSANLDNIERIDEDKYRIYFVTTNHLTASSAMRFVIDCNTLRFSPDFGEDKLEWAEMPSTFSEKLCAQS